MTHKSTWKKAEAKVAKFFNTTRTPLSGGNSKITRSDSLHSKLFIENKLKKKIAAVTLWDDANKKAKKENKIPVVTLQQKNRHGFWIFCHSEHFQTIANCLKMDFRKVVYWLATGVEKTLQKNDYKGAWETQSIQTCKEKLLEEQAEFFLAIDDYLEHPDNEEKARHVIIEGFDYIVTILILISKHHLQMGALNRGR